MIRGGLGGHIFGDSHAGGEVAVEAGGLPVAFGAGGGTVGGGADGDRGSEGDLVGCLGGFAGPGVLWLLGHEAAIGIAGGIRLIGWGP